MLTNQRHLFSLDSDICYLNNAFMAPSLKSVEEAGIAAVKAKNNPYHLGVTDFYDPVIDLKKEFAKLVDCDDHERIVSLASVSYGISTVAHNTCLNHGDEILLAEEQFPSNVYAWTRRAKQSGACIRFAEAGEGNSRGRDWNVNLLEMINDRTAVVSIGNIHWADGTLFDLKAIREKTKKHNALFIIDGTQSVGALPFSIKEIKPDALICAGYKWLMGPYSTAIGYFGEYFDQGIPIEENWYNRINSEQFADLVNYREEYKPKAGRFAVGESSNFILLPMFKKALEQLNVWTPLAIQEYCKSITTNACEQLRALGCWIEEDQHRAHHLFGVKLPSHMDKDELKQKFAQHNIHVSMRGEFVRISMHVYNTEEDLNTFINVLKQ